MTVSNSVVQFNIIYIAFTVNSTMLKLYIGSDVTVLEVII